MSTVSAILVLSERYCEATELAVSTLSTRVFNDGKVIQRLQQGRDITTGRASSAIGWFAANWPDGIQWPEDVAKPDMAEAV